MWECGRRAVLLVLVGVWTQLVMATTDPQPVLKHFNIYGCQNNSTINKLFRSVMFDSALLKPGFIGLDGTSTATVTLQQASASPCKLPTNVLFRAQPSTDGNKLTVTFQQVLTEDSDLHQNVTGKRMSGESLNIDTQLDNNTEQLRGYQDGIENKENYQENVTCSFTVNVPVSLLSGYGFIACQDDAGVGEDLWRAWQRAVTEVVEEAASGKAQTVTGVVIGTSVVAVLFVVCVLCRLRSARSTQHHSGRRPSATSLRTASTRDHHSSRT